MNMGKETDEGNKTEQNRHINISCEVGAFVWLCLTITELLGNNLL